MGHGGFGDKPANYVSPVLRGVSSGDLPVAPLGTKNPVLKHYLSRPVRRQLDWKEKPNGAPIRKPLDGVLAVQAGFIQTRGEIAETPCTSCSKGKGIWKSCVVGDRIGQPKPSSEVCGNCLFSKSWTCSQRMYLSDGAIYVSLTTNSCSVQGFLLALDPQMHPARIVLVHLLPKIKEEERCLAILQRDVHKHHCFDVLLRPLILLPLTCLGLLRPALKTTPLYFGFATYRTP